MSQHPTSGAPRDAPPSVRVHLATDRYAIGEWRCVFFFVWRATTRLVDLDAARVPFADWLRRAQADGGAVFTLVERDVGPPAEDARERLNEVRASGRGVVRAMASVYETQGFAAAALRSVATSVSVATKAAFPQRSFGAVGEAAAWFCAQLAGAGGPALRADELIAALTELRAAGRSRAPR